MKRQIGMTRKENDPKVQIAFKKTAIFFVSSESKHFDSMINGGGKFLHHSMSQM